MDDGACEFARAVRMRRNNWREGIMVGGFLRKMRKSLSFFCFVLFVCFFAFQMEKPEINILQKEWGKKAFLLLR